MAGIFITLEGGEGCGKSTQLPRIRGFFEERGFKVQCAREPGGTLRAEEIRSVLLSSNKEEDLCPKSELLLMYAARAQLVETRIRPWLESGCVVISDRFDLSTVAYQGYGRGFDLEEIATLRKFTIGDLRPDLTLLFDCDVSLGMSRVASRGGRDRFEQERQVFFEKVRKGYLEYARAHPDEVCVIDGSKSMEQVTEQIFGELRRRLGLS